jgi:lipopolysaccharide transport system permease protein
VVGILWAILRPALTTVVFTLVFGRLGKFPSSGVPYPVLVLTGMLPWQLFSAGMSESGQSLLSNSGLITKVYFPRLIIPGSSLVTSLIDFSISLGMLTIVMIAYGVVPGWQLIFLPAFALLALGSAASLGIWISALNVRYRDIAFVVPFLTQLGLYISPVGFSSAVVPEKWRLIYQLNPVVGIIDGFRWCVLAGRVPLPWTGLASSIATIVILATTGFFYFRRTERTFADVI